MLKPNDLGLRAAVVFCPLLRRRVAKPPGAKLFGSREAYGLTYAFCQAAGSSLVAAVAADVGASVPRVRRAMRSMGFFGGRLRIGGPVKHTEAVGLLLSGLTCSHLDADWHGRRPARGTRKHSDGLQEGEGAPPNCDAAVTIARSKIGTSGTAIG